MAGGFVVKNINASVTIEKCREIFSRFGIPKMLVTDNGRTFVSEEFQNCIKINGIIHKRSAPYHPATNGLAERFVQTLKQALRKTEFSNENIVKQVQKFLFHYRVTPIPELRQSPAERIFGRNLRSRLDLIFPMELENENKTWQHDGVTRSFRIGDRVSAREYLNKNCKWKFGVVHRILGKVHYLAKMDGGKIWKRHIDQLRANKCLAKQTNLVERERLVNEEPIVENARLKDTGQPEEDAGENPPGKERLNDAKSRPRRTVGKPSRFADYLCSF